MKLVSILLSLGMLLPLAAAPKRQPGVAATQCATCHGKEKVLPAGHAEIRKAKAGSCGDCHTGETALRAKLPLSHRHALAGVTCADCHGKGRPEAKAKPEACVRCHEMDALIARTAQAKDHNPHADQHGYAANCNLCHHQHKPSKNYCLTCHSYNWPVP